MTGAKRTLQRPEEIEVVAFDVGNGPVFPDQRQQPIRHFNPPVTNLEIVDLL
jgi:hypothetical protein